METKKKENKNVVIFTFARFLEISLCEKCGVCSGPYFLVFGLNTVQYGPEKTIVLGRLSRSADEMTVFCGSFISPNKNP